MCVVSKYNSNSYLRSYGFWVLGVFLQEEYSNRTDNALTTLVSRQHRPMDKTVDKMAA
jgi:hypothetical protein